MLVSIIPYNDQATRVFNRQIDSKALFECCSSSLDPLRFLVPAVLLLTFKVGPWLRRVTQIQVPSLIVSTATRSPYFSWLNPLKCQQNPIYSNPNR